MKRRALPLIGLALLVLVAYFVLDATNRAGPGSSGVDTQDGASAARADQGAVKPSSDAATRSDRAGPSSDARQRDGEASNSLLRVRCVWADDEAPVAGVRAKLYRRVAKRLRFVCDLFSDERGEATCDQLEAGEYSVRARRAATSGKLRAGEDLELELRLEVRARVSGRVVDTAQRGIADAHIEFADPHSLPYRVATTRSDGRFVARLADRGKLWARKAAWLPSRPQRVAAGEQRIVVVLEKGSVPLGGIVVDDEHRPQAGAKVALAAASAERGPLFVECGADGRFVFSDAPPGRTTLYARADRHARCRFDLDHRAPGRHDLVLRLTRGATVHGVVRRRDGRPLPGTFVQAHREQRLVGLSSVLSDTFTFSSCLAESDGRFRLEGVSPGRMWLAALTFPQPQTKSVLLKEGQVLEWNPVGGPPGDGTIRGVLLGPKGERLEGWTIRSEVLNLETMQLERVKATSDAQGKFVLQGLRDVPHALTLHPRGKYDTLARLEGIRPGPSELRWRLTFDPALRSSLRIKILDQDGKPLPTIKLYARAHGTTRPAKPGDAAGEYEFVGLPAGTWSLSGRLDGYGRFELGKHFVPAGTEHRVADYRLPALGRVVLRGVEAKLLAKLRVELRQTSGGRTVARDFAVKGARLEAAVPPGRYELTLLAPDAAPQKHDVVVEPGRERVVDIVLEAATRCVIRFVPEDLAAAQWRDTLRVVLKDARGVTLVDRSFAVRGDKHYDWVLGLRPGSYQLEAKSFSMARRRGRLSFVVKTEGRAPIELRLAVTR